MLQVFVDESGRGRIRKHLLETCRMASRTARFQASRDDSRFSRNTGMIAVLVGVSYKDF